MIYNSLKWVVALSSFTGCIICTGKPSVEVRREAITLCVTVTEVDGRHSRCMRKETHFFRTSSPVLALVFLHLSGTMMILHHRFRFVKLGAGPF